MSRSSAQLESVAAEGLTYAAVPGVFDEMQERGSIPREHWRSLAGFLQELGPHELRSRSDNGRRILRDHGVSYNQYGDPAGVDRPWGLDLVPLIITKEEWSAIELGLIQRSRLLNLILSDIYFGPQRLLRDGFIPPELVYANERFLRPCRGTRPVEQVYLHLYACDLGRSPDGRWWALSDRTEAPSGSGYSLENRTVISRILPEQIRQGQVERLAGFFQRQREMLFRLAPPRVSQPTIALLTAGPASQAYFEDAYLARHMGFPLVEGADLTVRERKVFLKTIEGLHRVDVLLRRVDDAWCDPLELRGDSLLGVSGLVEACRAGNVSVANALGSGLMESPSFLAFLPNLCRHLLGEELLLPSVATWWCGQPAELKYVQDHLQNLILKPAFRQQASLPLPAAGPGTRGKSSGRPKSIVRMLQADPKSFVAQELVKLSRAPVWLEGRLVPRPVVVRAFVATDGQSYSVMPGGLTRIADNPNDLLSYATSRSSKDTWIISGAPSRNPEQVQFAAESRALEPVLIGVPSRVADHLFWLGRYTERLEQLLRIVRCVLARVGGEPGPETEHERRALMQLCANLGLCPPRFCSTASNGELSQHMLELLYATDSEQGMRPLLKRIRGIASAVRDRFSGDTWRILGRLESDSRARPGQLALASATTLSHNLVLDLAAFNGMEMENMTRGPGWRFLDLGRRLERGLSVLNLLRSAVALSLNAPLMLEPVLEIADSVMTYRRQYFDAPRLSGVLALLLLDNSNPRSVAFQVQMLSEHVRLLAVSSNHPAPQSEQARLDAFARNLSATDAHSLSALLGQGASPRLLDMFNDWIVELAALSDQVTSHYFSHTFSRLS